MGSSIEARFEGHEIIEAGTTPIPNLLIWYYVALGLKDGHHSLITHILSYKWTKAAPFPTIKGLRMSASVDTRRRYIRELRNLGLLFTKRLYWTNADKEKHKERANPGRLRANTWYMGSLLHNLVRVQEWQKEKKPLEKFCVEVPLKTVQMFLNGDFNDTPVAIAEAIRKQTENGIKPVLLCENNIVGSTMAKQHSRSTMVKQHSRPTMAKASTRKASTSFSHTHEEESDSKKNHPFKKNEEDSFSSKGKELENSSKPDSSQNGTGANLNPGEHQPHINKVLNEVSEETPVEAVARHLCWGIKGPDGTLPRQKKYKKPWTDAAQKLLAETDEKDWAGVCAAIDSWFEAPPKSDQWTWENAKSPHHPIDAIARYYYTLRKPQTRSWLPPEATPAAPVPAPELSPMEKKWRLVLAQLEKQMAQETFDSWLADTAIVTFDEQLLVVRAKSDFAQQWLTGRLIKPIQRTVTSVLGFSGDIQFVVEENEAP